MLITWLLFVAVGLAFVLTGVARRYAEHHQLLDVPNERTSHEIPTPRGGGVAIVITFLLGLLVLKLYGLLDAQWLYTLAVPGLLVAAIGFADDLRHVPAVARLVVHTLAAGLVLFLAGDLPALNFLGHAVPAGVLVPLLVVYLVWLINLYNFMDGINGIAAIEAITVCVGAAVLYVLVLERELVWLVPLLLAVACVGFLVWNFPRARIFMGDAGSGFLGLILGVLSIQAAQLELSLFWAWLVLLGVFLVDATTTLLCRLLAGQNIFIAHRGHAYQVAARRYGSHTPVSVWVAIINLGWLLPLAGLVVLGKLDGPLAVLIAWAPLVYLRFHFRDTPASA